MAIANADGSIILTTKVDDSGIKKWIESIKSGTNQATEATKKYERQAKQSGEKVKLSFDDVGKSIQKVASYLGIAFGIKAFVQFSNASANMATQTEASVQRLVDIYGSASDAVGDFIDINARALGMSKAAAASFSSVYGNLFGVWADQATNAELTNRYLNMTAVVASKTGRTVEDVQERVRSGLLGNTEAIEDLGIFVNVKTIEMTDAFQRMANGKSWEQLDAYTQQQIRSMAILEQATAKYGDEVADTSATIRNRYKAAYEDFQNSWGNIVNTVLLPVLETLTQIFDIATKGLNALSGRSGQILENVELQEENTDKTAENIEEQTKNQKDLNKELKKTKASFDTVEILSEKIAENNEEQKNNPQNNLGNYDINSGTLFAEEINTQLLAIMSVVETALIAIGLILMMTGNIGWGLGFIIAGGILLTITASSVGQTDIDEQAKNKISGVMEVVGGAFIAIGLLLLFLGQVPWGLGFMAFGGGLIGISQVFATTSSNDIISTCDAILSFLAGLTAYLIANALLTHWGTFVTLWGNFHALLQLIVEHGFFNTIITLFGTSLSTIQLWGIAIGVIVAGIAYLAINWDKLAPAQRTITILTSLAAAATAAAVAIALFHTSWSVGVAAATIAAGVALLAGTALFKSYNGKKDLSGGGEAPASIEQYAYLAEGGTYKLPALAKGAVIPPNREFLAVLGDQKQGVNIEAPLQTIVDAFNIALAQNGGASGGNTEVVLEIDGREFGRAVVEQGNRENRRIGTRLVIAK